MKLTTHVLAKTIAYGIITAMSGIVATAQTTQSAKPLRWDQQRIQDYPIYKLLSKERSLGNGVPEAMQWELAKEEGKRFVDEKREANLAALLKEYPNSDYADDAALLLARCKYLYHGDVDGAIKGLYEVIQKYTKVTKSSWIAEDDQFRQWAMFSNVRKDGSPSSGWFPAELTEEQIAAIPKGKSRDEWEPGYTYRQEVLAYFEYWTEHPNWTEDEARYWIAWIIMQAGVKERMGEAEKVLRQVIDSYRTEPRTKIDKDAAKQRPYGEGITKYMERTELRAHWLLMELLQKEGKLDAVKAEATDYVKLHEGHDSVNDVRKFILDK